ncbi:MAG: DNA-methyltransferase [Gammaproteobacteria bacterium]
MQDTLEKKRTRKNDGCKRQVDTLVIPPPYYQDDYVTIYNANCLDIMGSLVPDVIITDPPYPDYYVDEYKYNPEAISILRKFACRQFVFWSAKQEFPLCFDARHVWDKITGAANQYDFIYERNGQKKQKVFRGHRINSTVSANFAMEKFYGHKSQKPIRLIKKIIKEYTNINDLILDPFMGSGTTVLAAKQLRRKAIGIEINEKWCKVAIDRLSQGILPL